MRAQLRLGVAQGHARRDEHEVPREQVEARIITLVKRAVR